MPAYKLRKQIPSYFITKAGLASLENYIKKEIPRILQLTEEDLKEARFSISVTDGPTEETFASMVESNEPLFRNNIRRITLESWSYLGQSYRIRIVFDAKRENSEIELTLHGTQNHEKASAIQAGIASTLEIYRTPNWWLHPNMAVQILLPGLIFSAIVSSLVSPISNPAKIILAVLLFVVLSYFFLLQPLKKYSTFDTNKQKRYDKLFWWVILGFGTFIVFGCVFTFLRQKTMGF